MKRYYNNTTGEWYTEGTTIVRRVENGIFTGVPTVEMLTEWGFVEYVEPAPTLDELKAAKIAEVEAYDASDAVNSFTIGGVSMWLNAATRQQLKVSIEAYQTTGIENVTKWFGGASYTFPTATWLQMLAVLEVYAGDALNVTEGHKAAINALTTKTKVKNYDYTTGYPEKPAF